MTLPLDWFAIASKATPIFRGADGYCHITGGAALLPSGEADKRWLRTNRMHARELALRRAMLPERRIGTTLGDMQLRSHLLNARDDERRLTADIIELARQYGRPDAPDS
jgi:hypothetical protein